MMQFLEKNDNVGVDSELVDRRYMTKLWIEISFIDTFSGRLSVV